MRRRRRRWRALGRPSPRAGGRAAVPRPRPGLLSPPLQKGVARAGGQRAQGRPRRAVEGGDVQRVHEEGRPRRRAREGETVAPSPALPPAARRPSPRRGRRRAGRPPGPRATPRGAPARAGRRHGLLREERGATRPVPSPPPPGPGPGPAPPPRGGFPSVRQGPAVRGRPMPGAVRQAGRRRRTPGREGVQRRRAGPGGAGGGRLRGWRHLDAQGLCGAWRIQHQRGAAGLDVTAKPAAAAASNSRGPKPTSARSPTPSRPLPSRRTSRGACAVRPLATTARVPRRLRTSTRAPRASSAEAAARASQPGAAASTRRLSSRRRADSAKSRPSSAWASPSTLASTATNATPACSGERTRRSVRTTSVPSTAQSTEAGAAAVQRAARVRCRPGRGAPAASPTPRPRCRGLPPWGPPRRGRPRGASRCQREACPPRRPARGPADGGQGRTGRLREGAGAGSPRRRPGPLRG